MTSSTDPNPQLLLNEQELKPILLEWSTVFIRRSMHNFLRYTRSIGLSLAQMNVLMWLYHHPACEITRLEDMMQVSRPAASQMVERMVQQDLVTRIESPTDRRARLVSLTAHGRTIVEESINARQEWVDELMENIPVEQRTLAAAIFQRLTEITLQIEMQSAPPDAQP